MKRNAVGLKAGGGPIIPRAGGGVIIPRVGGGPIIPRVHGGAIILRAGGGPIVPRSDRHHVAGGWQPDIPDIRDHNLQRGIQATTERCESTLGFASKS